MRSYPRFVGRRSTVRKFLGVAVAGAVALVAAACGSGSGGGSGAAAAETSGPPLTKSPIVIGNIGTYSGPAGVENTEMPAFYQAFATYVNDHGGINGHPLKIIVVDDKNDAATAQAGVRTLVEQDHVIALMGVADSGLETTWSDYITQKNIPVIGAYSYTTLWNTDPDFFPSSTTVTAAVWAGSNLAKQSGKTNYGVVNCSEESACAQAVALHKQGAQAQGLTFGYGATASGSAPNYTANCLAAKNAGVQVLSVAVLGASSISRFTTDCARQNYKPTYVFNATSIQPDLLTNKNTDGALVPLTTFPWFYKGPETATFQSILSLAGISDSQNGPALPAAYTAAELFATAAANVPDDPTSADIVNGLYSVSGTTLGGLAPPLTFAKGAPTRAVDCYFVAEVHNGSMTAPQGLKTNCLTAIPGGM